MRCSFFSYHDVAIQTHFFETVKEKYSAETMNLYFTFEDLGQPSDQVLTNVAWWVLKKLGAKRFVRIV